MTAVSPAMPNEGAVDPRSGKLHHTIGIVWLVYFFSGISIAADNFIPIPSFYPIAGGVILYFAVARPLQVVEFVSRPIVWFWAVTALGPLAIYFLGNYSNPFAWFSVVGRVNFFALVAGSGVLFMDPGGRRLITSAARITLAIAVLTNFADLFLDNPYNSSEELGRTSGLYSDANRAAASIGALLLLSVEISKQSIKGLVVAGVSILAIVATQSRSGILFGGLLAAGYLFLPRGPGTLSAGARIGIGLVGVVLLVLSALTASQVLDFGYEQFWRIQSLFDLDISDSSSQDRFDAVAFAGRHFVENFWGGTGLGGSHYYGFSPHNAYLELGLEYGIGGLLLYIFFLVHAGMKSLQFGWRRTQTQLLILLQLVYYGFFSHTVHGSPIAAVFFAAVIVNVLVEEPTPADESRVQI